MTRISVKLFSALFALGCGSGAMASPAHGQWTDNTGPTQSAPSPTGEDQNVPPSAPSDAQGGYQGQSQSQPQSQSQSQSQSQDQDQDEDTVETQTWQAGQSHLGVMVMQMTPELRKFFGITSDRGVLVARVEPNSAASRAGIQVGDVLTRVAQQPVRSGDDVLQALAARQGGRIRIAVVRQGRMVRLMASLPGASTDNSNSNNSDNNNRI
jgi:membrane-associated protease RseP (regulator of RpoE activity)